jgi:hypothetical protein
MTELKEGDLVAWKGAGPFIFLGRQSGYLARLRFPGPDTADHIMVPYEDLTLWVDPNHQHQLNRCDICGEQLRKEAANG